MASSTSLDNAAKPSPSKRIGKWLAIATREFLSIVIWVYTITEIFIFDVDYYLIVHRYPSLKWLVNYKFFILLAVFVIVLITVKAAKIWEWALYILFYPFILLFWRIPVFIYKRKSWNLALAFCNAILSLIRSFKYSFIVTALFVLDWLLIRLTSNFYLLVIGISVMTFLLIQAFMRRILSMFQPSSSFKIQEGIFRYITKHCQKTLVTNEEIKNIPFDSLSQQQVEKWTSNLQLAVLYNRICLFTAKRFDEYHKSRLNYVSYLFTLIMLFVFMLFSFSLINYGLFKAHPSSFLTAGDTSLFNFFYYSFKGVTFNTISEITPIDIWSRLISIAEAGAFVIFSVILVALFLITRSQKYSSDLTTLITKIQADGETMESIIQAEYKMNSIDEAITALRGVKAGLLNFIFWISKAM